MVELREPDTNDVVVHAQKMNNGEFKQVYDDQISNLKKRDINEDLKEENEPCDNPGGPESDFQDSASAGAGPVPGVAPPKIAEDVDQNRADRGSQMTREEEEVVEEENNDNNDDIAVTTTTKSNGQIQIVQPHSQLPKPEAPAGISLLAVPDSSRPAKNDDGLSRSKSLTESLVPAVNMPSIGKFFKERSSSLSATIAKRLSSSNGDENKNTTTTATMNNVSGEVTEFNISGLKVVVRMKNDNVVDGEQLKGRITFFSRSNCRDCTAVRSFFKERGLKFVEINIDVYPCREKELIERTGSAQVPQIFFNEKLFGGLVALNSLRNSGGFDQRLKEMIGRKCGDDAPAPPVYGFDDPGEEEELTDELVSVVRVLRQKLPIQDRLMKMKIVKNCFAGAHLVEALIHHLDCGRKKAVEIGKQLARKHFIHHVFGENDFEDGNQFYRFLEHEPFIPKCHNFRGSTNDSSPKPAALVGQRIYKIMSAIIETYASDDRSHVDYAGISKSEEFRRYVNVTQELHRIDLQELSPDEKLAFFLNLHNAMVIHAVIRLGCPEGIIDRRSFYSDFQYVVGGYSYSLNTIKNGILRNNRRSPYSFVKPLGNGDKRLEIAVPKLNPLIHFGLCNGTKSSPTVRFFRPQAIESELRCAAREFFQRGGVEVNLEKRTISLSRIINWFDADFGQEKEILKWIIIYLDATKAGLLTHLLGDGSPVNTVYQNYDWTVNS